MKNIQDILKKYENIKSIVNENNFQNPRLYLPTSTQDQHILHLIIDDATATDSTSRHTSLIQQLEQELKCKVTITITNYLSNFYHDYYSKNAFNLDDKNKLKDVFEKAEFEELNDLSDKYSTNILMNF